MINTDRESSKKILRNMNMYIFISKIKESAH